MAASSHDRGALAALAEFIYENAKRKLDADGNELTEDEEGKLDAVVITGDIATTGSADDVERAESSFGRTSTSSFRTEVGNAITEARPSRR